MSSTGLNVKRPEGRKRNRAKAVEDLLASWQRTLAEEQQRQQEILENNIILAENLYTLERLQAVYDQHQRWLEAEGPVPDNQGQQGAQQQQQTRQTAHADAHWVLFLLETASWEQLQVARRMTAADWVAYQHTYCKELLLLRELSHRDVALQQELMDVAGVDLTPESMPAVYDCVSSFCQSHSSSGGSKTNTSNRPATWDVIMDKLKSTGRLVYLALLHREQAIFEAANKNLGTGLDTQAPPLHWASVARRMKFSRQQKLHFKLALQNFARQSRALAAKGLDILQQTPSYAFILACEMIAARQLDDDGNEAGASVEPSSIAAATTPAATAAVAAAAAGNQAASNHNTIGNSRTVFGNTDQHGLDGTAGTGATLGVSQPAAATTGPEPASSTAGAAAADEEILSAEGMDAAGEQLQRQMAMYFRNLINLNIFLADTLTLEQALILNVASYPYWPMLSAVAEAAIQLPDAAEPEADAHPGIQRLMAKRRSFMQQAHDQWWSDQVMKPQ